MLHLQRDRRSHLKSKQVSAYTIHVHTPYMCIHHTCAYTIHVHTPYMCIHHTYVSQCPTAVYVA